MRAVRAVVFLVATGCASGSTPAVPVDASEEPVRMDATESFVDARPDAPAPDAAIVPPDACVPQQFEKLANPVFDLAPTGTGWTEVTIQGLSGGPYPIITADGLTAQSAPNKAWLGGAAGQDVTPAAASVTDQLYQDVAIPVGTTQVTISGYYAVGTTETLASPFDTFSLDVVQPNGTPIENVLALNNTMAVGTFTAFSKTLTANVAGQAIRLRATSTNDGTLHSNFFLDTLSLKATHCP